MIAGAERIAFGIEEDVDPLALIVVEQAEDEAVRRRRRRPPANEQPHRHAGQEHDGDAADVTIDGGAQVGLDEDQRRRERRSASAAGQIARQVRISPGRQQVVEAGQRQRRCAGFMNSDGCRRMKPRSSQRCAPLPTKPSISTATSISTTRIDRKGRTALIVDSWYPRHDNRHPQEDDEDRTPASPPTAEAMPPAAE